MQNGALSGTAANLILAPGDRLSVDFAGTLTALAGVVVVVTFEPYYETKDISWNMNANAGIADGTIFIADRPYLVWFASAVHAVAAGAASNVQITVDRALDAPGAGSDLLSNDTAAGFELDATANTVQVGTWVSSGLNYLLPGDRLSLDFSGTLTTLSGLQITITLQLA